MPGNYVPCRTAGDDDDDIHLFLPGNPDESLCGREVSGRTRGDDSRRPCRDCARRLLVLTFREAAPGGGAGSIEVVVRP